MIVTLTPNPALDLTYHLDTLDVGASQRVPPAQQRAGGKGINVARVLHGQGRATHVVAPVGGSTGGLVRADLVASGLPHTLLEVGLDTRRTLALVTPTATTNLNESGLPLAAEQWDGLAELTAAALGVRGSASVLVCSGSLPQDAPPDAISRMVGVAHAAGARCIVDTSSGRHLLAAAGAGADVLKPNHHELLAVVGGTDVLAAARALARHGGSVVYASLGAAGLLRVPAEGEVLHARLSRSLTGNTTGAGDAAVAAIAASLASGAGPEDTLRLATAWSGAAVLHPLAGSITDPAPLLAEITVDTVTAAPALED
ncbi:1-phosphofructokinase family hexose kinase [Pseudactinotalea suaedae]|uniref:1-phosphofructokinase family hexose kinase n=1 Tax=Pseudactinotalea suaedae TaxID=1524924 RepID=UPI0012E26B91|nr:hexose kinase [Pseudactinotalea suaedae]